MENRGNQIMSNQPSSYTQQTTTVQSYPGAAHVYGAQGGTYQTQTASTYQSQQPSTYSQGQSYASQLAAACQEKQAATYQSQGGATYQAQGAGSYQGQGGATYQAQTAGGYHSAQVVGQESSYTYQQGPTTTEVHTYQSGPFVTQGSGQASVAYGAESVRSVSGTTLRGKEYVTGTRVVGHEYGEQRVISTSQRVDESRQSIISERFIEHEIKVPKKVIREEVIEKVIIVPEKLVHEEFIEEIQKVREKIIEIAKPIIQEKIIEVPEYEYVEKLIEVPEKIIQEKIKEVARVEYQERIIEVPKIITQERVVEVPDIQYREIPYERIVEVPEIREEIVIKEVPVPQYIEKPIAQFVDVEVATNVERNLPVPVEAVTTFEFSMPRLRPRYSKVTYPVYLPRFIEVPVAQELLNQGLVQTAERYLAQTAVLSGTAASLCEIENLAAAIMKADFQTHLQSTDLQSAVIRAWQTGMLQFNQKSTVGPVGMVPISAGGQMMEQKKIKKHKKHTKSSRM